MWHDVSDGKAIENGPIIVNRSIVHRRKFRLPLFYVCAGRDRRFVSMMYDV